MGEKCRLDIDWDFPSVMPSGKGKVAKVTFDMEWWDVPSCVQAGKIKVFMAAIDEKTGDFLTTDEEGNPGKELVAETTNEKWAWHPGEGAVAGIPSVPDIAQRRVVKVKMTGYADFGWPQGKQPFEKVERITVLPPDEFNPELPWWEKSYKVGPRTAKGWEIAGVAGIVGLILLSS